MINKNLGFKNLNSGTIGSLPRSKILMSISIAIVLAATVNVFSLMGANAMANPCSDITSTGGNGGPGGPGGIGIGISIGGPGVGIGGNGGQGGAGGSGTTTVECQLEDVIIVE